MLGGDPWASQCSGFNFIYVAPRLYVNQWVGLCMAMVGRDHRLGLPGMRIGGGVVAFEKFGSGEEHGWCGRCCVRKSHWFDSRAWSCFRDMSSGMVRKPGEEAIG
jgi:hypothetical protein